MRKTLLLIFALFVSAGIANAKPVTQITAQTVASNFYAHTFKSVNSVISLAYTGLANDGSPAYYVFNINQGKGFVIVAAEDAAYPILAYSDKGQFVIPHDNNNLAWWLNCRTREIGYARAKNITASSDIIAEWSSYASNKFSSENNQNRIESAGPLLSSTWNQSPYYNAMCPGGSVTGCVATAMAQIMRYWQYPSHGHGYSSYWDQHSYGFQKNYGYLFADYDTSNYAWAWMPLNLSSNNNEVAELMYDCGVSVCMDYSPSGSGAWVINRDYPVSAQNSYVKYFGYNPATVQGVYKANYTLGNWINLIENEINQGRPVQYVGNDSLDNEGHTWVCDGYDINNNFHMNWGWGGSDNGYYSPTALNVIGYDFDWWDEAVIGIEPPAVSPYFSGTPTFGCKGLTVNFSDSSISKSPITAYKWLFPGGTPSSSTSPKPSVVYNTPGTYNVTEIVSDTSGTDTVTRKAYISVSSSTSLPMVQDYESNTFPAAGWVVNNPNSYSYTWQMNGSVGGYGKSGHCMYFNNAQAAGYFFTIITGLWNPPPGKAALDIIGEREQIYSPKYDFTGIYKPTLYFDVAYAPYNNTFSDTLVIYYSTDCGATFHQVYFKGGMTLCTTGETVMNGADTNSNGVFVPLKNNWRTDTVYIPAIAGAPEVMFSFENRSGNGSPIYIDNINIPGVPAYVTNASTSPSVVVYPNPGNGLFTMALANVPGNPMIKIYNILGQQVYEAVLKNGNAQINLTSQAKGVYIYKLISEKGSSLSTGKLVIE